MMMIVLNVIIPRQILIINIFTPCSPHPPACYLRFENSHLIPTKYIQFALKNVDTALINKDVNKAIGIEGPKILKHCATLLFQPIASYTISSILPSLTV